MRQGIAYDDAYGISLPTPSACWPLSSLPAPFLVHTLLAHHMGLCVVQAYMTKQA